MTTTTNFNVSPYFDDYDEEKNYHRILFRPAVPVQARELTQLQTILQNQIERFGDNIYKTGTIIKGCTFTFDQGVKYVKVLDLQPNGLDVEITLAQNTFVTDSTGLMAEVLEVSSGFESQAPNLNTLYLKYINTGSSGGSETKVFTQGTILTSYNKTYPLESIIVNSGGSGYSNASLVTITANNDSGTGAQASVVTFANGTISSIVVTQQGANYTNPPSVTVANGVGGSFQAINYTSRFTIAGSALSPTGNSYLLSVSEGVIYQKGFFSRVNDQRIVVSKYTSLPSGVAVGFDTQESVVTSSSDTSLLDNASGYTNAQAPGANRLKLSPTLKVISRSDSASNTNFLALLEYEDGRIVRDRTETQFNSINTELSRRTFEESGNYVTKPFSISTKAISGNTTHVGVVIGPGSGYVEGHRVTLLNNAGISIQKANTTQTIEAQTITTSYGNYVIVDEYCGYFSTDIGKQVSLRSAAADQISTNPGFLTSPGVEIGTANIRAVVYDSGEPGTPTARYRIYLFNIRMGTNKKFEDIRAISVSSEGVADIVLESGKAVLYDKSFDTLVFNSGAKAVKQFENEEFVYRTEEDATLDGNGNTTITFTTIGQWPYTTGSTLNNIQERDFIVVPKTTITGLSGNPGTVTTSGTSVTGVATTFTSTYKVGQFIKIGGLNPVRITNIISDTSLTTATAAGSAAANTHTYVYPANVPISTSQSASYFVQSSSQIIFSLGHAIVNTSPVIRAGFNVKYVGGAKSKTLKTVYVKLNTTSISSRPSGPWCLGIPDAHRITGVWVGSSTTYSDATANRVSSFELDNGQRDSYYGLSYLSRKPGTSLSLSSTNNLLVRLEVFETSGSVTYYSTESYPVDDSSAPAANTLRSQAIPVFNSTGTGKAIDLRDAVDFRPQAANTAALSTTIGGATISPAETLSFGTNDKYFPSPVESFEGDVISYLPRKDLIVIDTYGRPSTITGTPSLSPREPSIPEGSMVLGVLTVPPFPSLSAKEAADSRRPDYAVLVNPSQQKGFTMRDIQSISDRISKLEYYTLLNALEQSTKNLTIPSSSNNSIERFKNGFFVDPFNDYTISNVNDNEYYAIIDTRESVLRPPSDTFDIALSYAAGSSTGVVKKGDFILPTYDQEVLLDQAVATKQRTLVDKFWSFKGVAFPYPQFDNFFDVQKRPVNVTIDTASPVRALATALNTNFPVTSSFTSFTAPITLDATLSDGTQLFSQTTSTTRVDRRQQIFGGQETPTTQQVGDFLTDFSVQQYIRPQRINIFASGLRPNARHYIFFDKENVSNFCAPATLSTTSGEITESNFIRSGNIGAAITTNSNGVLAAILYLPADTFFIGEREIFIMDFDSLSSIESATSTATSSFVAYNFTGTASSLSLSTKSVAPFSIGSQTVGTTVTSTRNSWSVAPPPPVIPAPEITPWDSGWGGGDGGGDSGDPISQTFSLKSVNGNDGFFVTSIDVYFSQKDPLRGVTLELRETSAGIPLKTAIPKSRVWKTSSDVSVSNNASLATTFTFETPVYVRADNDYAITLYPDALSPDYRIWVSKVGDPNVSGGTSQNNRNWGNGTLFYSTSGSAWTPVQDEDMKFKLRVAKFTALNSELYMVNKDYEFLSIDNLSGYFTGGEYVAQLRSTYEAGRLVGSTTSNVLTGDANVSFGSISSGNFLTLFNGGSTYTQSNCLFTTTGTTLDFATGNSEAGPNLNTDFTPGDFIRFGSSANGEIRQVVSVANSSQLTFDGALTTNITSGRVHRVNSPTFDIVKVASANTTAIVVDRTSKANGYFTYQKSATGRMVTYGENNGQLILTDSNANTVMKFAANTISYLGTLVSDVSSVRATVTSVNNININRFAPYINRIVLPGTTTNLNVGIRKESSNTTIFNDYTFGALSKVNFESNILSKSNENGVKSLRVRVPMTTRYSYTAPVVDIEPASLLIYRNLINNTVSGETTRFGSAVCKHITKRIELADGLDAEDIIVYLTAYKPAGTEVYVYTKILNSADDESFNDKAWTLLTQETNVRSAASVDELDRREYKYTVPFRPPVTQLSGLSSNTTTTTITGDGTLWNTAGSNKLDAGDLILVTKATLDSTVFDVRKVETVSSDTVITIDSALSAPVGGTGLIISKLTSRGAFLDSQDSNIIRYYDNEGALHKTYKYMALKIVLTSSYSYLVPTVDDVRAMCVSV